MALISRLKTWVSGEILTASDLNGEFDNLLNNGLLNTAIVGSSSDVTAMRVTVDPGEVGTESLASSNDGEVKRLRNIVKETTGETQWYETPAVNLSQVAFTSSFSTSFIRQDIKGTAFTVSGSTPGVFTDIVGYTATITSTGGTLVIFGDMPETGSITRFLTAGSGTIDYKIIRDSTTVGSFQLNNASAANGGGASPISIFIIEAPVAATYVYKVQHVGSGTFDYLNLRLRILEI